MILTTKLIVAYQELMTNPKDHGLPFKSLNEIFEASDEVTPKHILYETYLHEIDKTKEQLPKIIFYIVMEQLYRQGVAKTGELGYKLKLNTPTVINTIDSYFCECKGTTPSRVDHHRRVLVCCSCEKQKRH